MKVTVWIISMMFPSASETFAGVTINALRSKGVRVEVHSLRSPAPGTERMIAERSHTGMTITHSSTAAIARGCIGILIHPLLTAGVLLWVLGCCWRRPMQIIKSLLILPRCLDLFGAISRARPDVVHLYWGHYPCILGYLLHRNLPGVVLTMSLQAYDLRYRYGGSAYMARHAGMVRTGARDNVHTLQEMGVPLERIEVIYNGIDLSRAREIASRETKISRRIVTAGRLLPFKAMDDVLKAFAAVHAEYPDASLAILGDGPERKSLEDLASELGIRGAVEFRGHVSHDQVLTEMARAEVFLFMSRREVLPNVVKEAMSCGCACVVAYTPGMEELLEDRRHGFIVQPGDVDSAANCVKEVFADPLRCRDLISEGRRHIQECFDVERTAQQYITRWRALLDADGRHSDGVSRDTASSKGFVG